MWWLGYSEISWKKSETEAENLSLVFKLDINRGIYLTWGENSA